MKKISKILIGIVVVFALIIAAVFIGSAGVNKQADLILEQFEQGDIEQVYDDSLMSSTFTLEEFSERMGVGTDFSILDAEKISWTGRGFKNEFKYIYGDFKFQSGEVETLTFSFIKQDGELKLSGITPGQPD